MNCHATFDSVAAALKVGTISLTTSAECVWQVCSVQCVRACREEYSASCKIAARACVTRSPSAGVYTRVPAGEHVHARVRTTRQVCSHLYNTRLYTGCVYSACKCIHACVQHNMCVHFRTARVYTRAYSARIHVCACAGRPSAGHRTGFCGRGSQQGTVGTGSDTGSGAGSDAPGQRKSQIPACRGDTPTVRGFTAEIWRQQQETSLL